MNQFRPVFAYEVNTKLKEALEKEFELTNKLHKDYFDTFKGDVQVIFNGTNIQMISILGDFTPQQFQEHQDKIRMLIAEIMKRQPPLDVIIEAKL